jgi:c-di-AMP phosphodiesterase-like protein
VERLPQPEALLAGMEARTRDFDLLAGVAAAYLKARGVAHA